MAFVAPAVAIGSAIFSGVQQVRAGNAAKDAGKAEKESSYAAARMYEFNAKIAEAQARDAEKRGDIAVEQFRSQVRGFIGSQRAAQAASGIDVNFGSAVDVQADTAYLGELDALTLQNNFAREAWGYRVQAVDAQQRAYIARREGINAAAAGQSAGTAAYWGAGATLLNTGASLVANRYGFKKAS